MRQLARRSDPASSPEEQWFAVWDIVFPSGTRPARAVLSSNLETAVGALRNFWAKHGRRIVARFMEKKQLRDYGKVQDEERGLAALYTLVLEQLIRTVIARFWETETGAEQVTASGKDVLAILRDLCCTRLQEPQPDGCKDDIPRRDNQDEWKRKASQRPYEHWT
jgi:hypothetical protein